ncbi:MAG: restriction endonuclease [Bacillota bacterium]
MDIRKANGNRLEDFVEHVYNILLNNENLRDVKIQKNFVEIGRSGAKHEFDILYEIKIAGVVHRVGIECKNHNRAITKGMVQEFKGKLDDTNNIQGVFISALGYQQGAQVLGEHYGIKLMQVTDLPRINELLASTIKTGMLPDKSIKGDPFWVIMENSDTENTTGSYFAFEGNQIILFLSRKSAERIVNRYHLTDHGVFGVARQHLKAICYMSKVFGYRLLICSKLLREPEEELMAWDYSCDDILDEFID